MRELNGPDPLTDDVIRLIEPNILDSLTPAQLSGIVRAISTSTSSNRLLDLRIGLPLFFARYYCVFIICRDRRAFRQKTESFRRNRYSLMGGVLFGAFAALPMLLAILIFLYIIKYLLGLDFIPDFHLYDVFK